MAGARNITRQAGDAERTPDNGVERGDDRRRVRAAQGAHLGCEPFPEPPDGCRTRFDQQLAVPVAADVDPQEIEALSEVSGSPGESRHRAPTERSVTVSRTSLLTIRPVGT